MSNQPASGPFCIQYHQSTRLKELLDDRKVFAVFQFDRDSAFDHDDPRLISIALPQINESKLIEVWSTNELVTQGVEDECIYQASESFLFISALINESRFNNISQATRYGYEKVTSIKNRLGYNHNTRLWNYFPDINREVRGKERYKQFCEGRHNVLTEHENFQENFSAATAIGSQGPGLMILSLSSRYPVSHVENPQQMSAYHYPENYGKKSPSFARATAMNIKSSDHLFVSGTSSILGHQSQHQFNVENQVNLTLDNIEVLLNHVKKGGGSFPVTIENLNLLKVYIRQEKDLPAIEHIIQRRFTQKVPVLYLRGDICRRELMVEVEGLYIQNCKSSI